MQRRQLLCLLSAAAALSLSGCGFKLRHARPMAFQSIQLKGFEASSPLAAELARALESSGVSVVDSVAQAAALAGTTKAPIGHVIFEAQRDTQDMVVAAKTAYGQVRSMTVRNYLTFAVKRADGSVLQKPIEIGLARDLSYNEQDALAKQDESAALNRAMQTDLVQQAMRRLQAIRPEQLPTPAEER